MVKMLCAASKRGVISQITSPNWRPFGLLIQRCWKHLIPHPLPPPLVSMEQTIKGIPMDTSPVPKEESDGESRPHWIPIKETGWEGEPHRTQSDPIKRRAGEKFPRNRYRDSIPSSSKDRCNTAWIIIRGRKIPVMQQKHRKPRLQIRCWPCMFCSRHYKVQSIFLYGSWKLLSILPTLYRLDLKSEIQEYFCGEALRIFVVGNATKLRQHLHKWVLTGLPKTSLK